MKGQGKGRRFYRYCQYGEDPLYSDQFIAMLNRLIRVSEVYSYIVKIRNYCISARV